MKATVTCGNLGELKTAVKTQAYEYSHVPSLPAARGVHTAIFAGYGNVTFCLVSTCFISNYRNNKIIFS